MTNKGKGKGKCKGKQTHRKTKPPNPLSECIFPREIISLIFSFLPVKSLIRVRCVCKPWRSLISNPKFISTHLNQSITATATATASASSLLIHSIHHPYSDHAISLLKLSSNSDPVTIPLDHPFPSYYAEMDVVGSAFGVVCFCHPPWGESIFLWNPATHQWTNVKLSGTKPLQGVNSRVSLGFGFDTDTSDCKVISILCFKPESENLDRVEVYSANDKCWKKLKFEPVFRVLGTKCSVVIKGSPYWKAVVEDVLGPREVLVCFDVKREVFHQLPMPLVNRGAHECIVDLKDSLGMLVWEDMAKGYVDVWEMDEENGWSKKFSVGPMFVERVVGCSRNGDIVAECAGLLLLYEIETKQMKCFCADNANQGCFEVFSYMESLIQIKRGATSIEDAYQKAEAGRQKLHSMGFNFKVCSTLDPSEHNFLL